MCVCTIVHVDVCACMCVFVCVCVCHSVCMYLYACLSSDRYEARDNQPDHTADDSCSAWRLGNIQVSYELHNIPYTWLYAYNTWVYT